MNKKDYFRQLINVSYASAGFQNSIANLQGLADSIMRIQHPESIDKLNELSIKLHRLYLEIKQAFVDELDKSMHNNDDAPSPTTNNE